MGVECIMAIGDVVAGIAAVTGVISFQPAAGVECIILSSAGGNTSNYVGVYSAAGNSSQVNFSTSGTAAHGARNGLNLRIAINNTVYFYASSNNYVG